MCRRHPLSCASCVCRLGREPSERETAWDQENACITLTVPFGMYGIPDTASVLGVLYHKLFPRHVRYCLVDGLYAACCMVDDRSKKCIESTLTAFSPIYQHMQVFAVNSVQTLTLHLGHARISSLSGLLRLMLGANLGCQERHHLSFAIIPVGLVKCMCARYDLWNMIIQAWVRDLLRELGWSEEVLWRTC